MKIKHTYRANHWKEQAENWHVAGLNFGGKLCGGYKTIELETKPNPSLVKVAFNFHTMKNQEFPPLSFKLDGGMS